jgi:hypothetical protein
MNINPIRVLTTSDRKPPLLPNSVGEHEGRRYLGNLRTEVLGPVIIRFNKTIVFPNIESQPEKKNGYSHLRSVAS